MAKPGTVFETATNTYTVKDTIGHGGAGTVFLVSDTDGEDFSLKCLRTTDTVKRKRFRNELLFCQREDHEHIIRVLDSGVFVDGKTSVPFYVMPHYDGTLRTLLQGKVEPGQVLPLFSQMLSGVEAAHLRGVHHRDLKPENILHDSSKHLLVVADFGIAHFEEDELLTAVETNHQERLANFIYAAPEQKVRGSKADARADVFALGLMLNEMFTGAVPAGVGYPLIATVSPAHGYLDQIVSRMIAHAPTDRYATIGKIKEDLIARGNAFIDLQKLDALRRTVVPASTPDDPLGGAEVRVVGVEYLPGGELVFRLDPPYPPAWGQVLKKVRGTYMPGIASPASVRFYGSDKMGVGASEATAPQIVGMFKEWVALANVEYRANLERDAARRRQERLTALAEEQRRAEEKARVTEKLAGLL